MRSQQDHGGQVQPALRQRREDGREPAGRTRCLDAHVRHVLGHVVLAHAVHEHGWVRRRYVELASVHLAEIAEHGGCEALVMGDGGGELLQQHAVWQMRVRVAAHGRPPRLGTVAGAKSFISRAISASMHATWAEIERLDEKVLQPDLVVTSVLALRTMADDSDEGRAPRKSCPEIGSSGFVSLDMIPDRFVMHPAPGPDPDFVSCRVPRSPRAANPPLPARITPSRRMCQCSRTRAAGMAPSQTTSVAWPT